MKKYKETGKIISQIRLASDVYSMWIETEEIAYGVKPGQFINLYTRDQAFLMPRPISVCEVNHSERIIRIVYRVVGKGTEEFSRLEAGDTIDIMGPLGNGFPLKNRKAMLIGGGVGIPPMLELAKRLEGKLEIILGFRDEVFLHDELEQYGNISITTETGNRGIKGNVMDAIRENRLDGEIIYACGPTPMLRAVKEYAKKNRIEAWLSLEEKMACGVGACLACTCNTVDIDDHSNVHNKRICKDGPVFLAEEVEI